MKRFAMLLLCALSVAAPALAASGGSPDPTGDLRSFDNSAAGGGLLDVVNVSHDNTADIVTYGLRTSAGFSDSSVSVITWFLQYPGDTECSSLSIRVRTAGAALGGEIVRCRVVGGQPTEESLGSAAVSHGSGSDTLTVSYPRSVFARAGVPTNGYDYFVQARGTDQKSDVVPNAGLIPHYFSGRGPGPAATLKPPPSPGPSGQPASTQSSTPSASSAPARSSLKPVTPNPVRTSPAATTKATPTPTQAARNSDADQQRDRLLAAGLTLGILALAGVVATVASRARRRGARRYP